MQALHILPLIAEGGICGSEVQKLRSGKPDGIRAGTNRGRLSHFLLGPSPLRCEEYQRKAEVLLNQRGDSLCG